MAENILKLRVDSQEYDNKLKRAAEGIQRYAEGCRKAGGTLEHLDEGVEQFVKELGKMETTSKSAKGSLNEMTKSFVDLSMQYKQLTDQEKAAPFGKALSASLDQLRSRIQQTKADLSDISSKLGDAGTQLQSSGSSSLFSGDKLSGMLQVFGGNWLTKGAGMAMNFVGELGDMVKQGIELAKAGEGVRIAFERLNQPGLLANLREATHGTVTDLELMKAAVKFNDFKLPVEELGTMLSFAQQKAKDTGQSVDYMVDSIVTGLGRKSLMILDNLGLSAAEIKERMKDTGDMTKAVGAIIRDQMAKAGDYIETAADRATKADVEVTNAMTRLGETFQPISDMGTSMWTNLKTGALDLLNNVLEPLINKFTELGRIRAGYAEQGGNEKVNRQLDRLRNIQTDNYRQGTYKAQLANYDQKINSYQQYLDDYKKWQSDKTAVGAYDRMQAFQKQTGLSMFSDVKEQLAIFQKMRAEYVQGAKSILDKTPAPSSNTNTTTTTTTSGTSPQKQAADKVATAQHEYAQSIEMAKMQLDNGTKTEADYKKQLLSAEERLWNALGDAYNIHKDPKYKEAQDECAAKIKQLGGEVNASIEAQKKQQEATRQLEQAEKKVADAMEKSADAWRKGDLQGYMQAQKSVGGDVSPAIGSDAFSYTSSNLDAFVGNLKQKLSQAEVGSTLYNNLTAQLADANALGNLMQTAIKNGIDVAQFDPQELWRKVFGDNPGDYISDETWENIRKKIEEIIGKPIKLNLKTGETTSGGRSSQKNNPYLKTREDGKTEASIAGVLGGLGSGMSQMVHGIEQLGIDVPEGLKNALNAMQGISTILTGIATTVLAIEAIAGADAIIPFANGGMVKAFSGTLVGNTYSGDQLRGIDQSGQLYGLNAGEVVLNRAQVGNISSQLSGGMAAMQLSAVITGEQLRLVLNNNGRRTGRGEYVTTNFR